jgi:hypothetical protein
MPGTSGERAFGAPTVDFREKVQVGKGLDGKFEIRNSKFEFSILLPFLIPRRLHLLPDVSQHACDQVEGDDPEHDEEECGWHPRIVAFRLARSSHRIAQRDAAIRRPQ